MKCSVVNCGLCQSKNRPNLTFHRLPRNKARKSEWLDNIGLKNLRSGTKNIFVCSLHFAESAFNKTLNIIKLRDDAVPTIFTKTNPNQPTLVEQSKCIDHQASTSHKKYRKAEDTQKNFEMICRMCLSTDLELCDMQKSGLDDLYVKLSGVKPRSEPALPQVVCGFCAHQLRKFLKLQQSARLANDTLHRLLREHGRVSVDLLKTVDVKPILRLGILPTRIISLTQDGEQITVTETMNKMQSQFEETYEDTNFHDVVVFEVGEDDEDNETTDSDKELADAVEETQMNLDDTFDDVMKPELLDMDILDDDEDLNYESSESCFEPLKTRTNRRVQLKSRKLEIPAVDPKVALNPEPEETLYIIKDLTFEEQIADIEKRKETKNYKGSNYQCNQCFKGFLDQKAYNTHMLRHNELYGSHACRVCKTRFKTPRRLRKHVTAHHSQKFLCCRCPYVTRNRQSARLHERIHRGVKYSCPHCQEIFIKLTTYLSHLRIKHPSDFVCELCGYSFVSLKGVDIHKKLKHRFTEQEIPEDAPYCEVCDIKFISEDALNTHQRVSNRHNKDGRKSRNEQQYATSARASLRPNPVSCEQCDQVLASPQAYFFHFRRQHPGETRTQYGARSLMCEQCGAVVQSGWHLRDHMQLHTGGVDLPCASCPKVFRTYKQREYHARVVHGPKVSAECPVCGKVIQNKCNLPRHMETHKEVRPVACESCDRRFASNYEQKEHYRHKHLGVPYPKKKKKVIVDEDIETVETAESVDVWLKEEDIVL